MAIMQLLYSSRPTVDLSMSEIDAILSVSRKNNVSAGVTGMLMYRYDLFLQFLEGSETEVMQILDRISVDPRHKNVCTLGTAVGMERFFPDWNMGYLSLTPENMRLLGDSYDATDFQASEMSFEELCDFMLRLSERARAQDRLLA